MLSTLDLTYASSALAAVVYGYVAYSAFAIGNTLTVRLYRRQALGIGLLAIIVGYGVASYPLTPPGYSPGLLGLAGVSLWYGLFIGAFYWIDASVRAARLTDPLLRDTLHWSRLRIAFWATDILLAIVFGPLVFAGRFNYVAPPSISVLLVFEIPVFITVLVGVVALPIAAHRSKDKVLRKHLYWFGLFLAIWFSGNFGGGSVLGALGVNVPPWGSPLYSAVVGYFLYRSVGSLVPLYKFNKEPVSRG